MTQQNLDNQLDIEAIYARNVDMVYRVCFSFLKNKADTEDAVHDTFMRCMRAAPRFANEAHEKGWLVVTAGNLCRNRLRHWWRKNTPLDETAYSGNDGPPTHDDTLDAILALPDRYKVSLYLHYYEGWPAGDIAALLRRPASTVRNHLSEARRLLKERLTDDEHT